MVSAAIWLGDGVPRPHERSSAVDRTARLLSFPDSFPLNNIIFDMFYHPVCTMVIPYVICVKCVTYPGAQPAYTFRVLWVHQPGSHRSYLFFSAFILRCLPSFSIARRARPPQPFDDSLSRTSSCTHELSLYTIRYEMRTTWPTGH